MNLALSLWRLRIVKSYIFNTPLWVPFDGWDLVLVDVPDSTPTIQNYITFWLEVRIEMRKICLTHGGEIVRLAQQVFW